MKPLPVHLKHVTALFGYNKADLGLHFFHLRPFTISANRCRYVLIGHKFGEKCYVYLFHLHFNVSVLQ